MMDVLNEEGGWEKVKKVAKVLLDINKKLNED